MATLIIEGFTFIRGPRTACIICQRDTVGHFKKAGISLAVPCCPVCREGQAIDQVLDRVSATGGLEGIVDFFLSTNTAPAPFVQAADPEDLTAEEFANLAIATALSQCVDGRAIVVMEEVSCPA